MNYREGLRATTEVAVITGITLGMLSLAYFALTWIGTGKLIASAAAMLVGGAHAVTGVTIVNRIERQRLSDRMRSKP